MSKTAWRLLGVSAVALFLIGALIDTAVPLPAGKYAYSESWPSGTVFDPRVSVVKGAAANTSIYVKGLAEMDNVLQVLFADTSTGALTWSSVIDSTYFQRGDTIRCGTTTAKGWLLIFWKKK